MNWIKLIATAIQFGMVVLSLYGLKEIAGDLHWSIEIAFAVCIFMLLDVWCAIRDKK